VTGENFIFGGQRTDIIIPGNDMLCVSVVDANYMTTALPMPNGLLGAGCK